MLASSNYGQCRGSNVVGYSSDFLDLFPSHSTSLLDIEIKVSQEALVSSNVIPPGFKGIGHRFTFLNFKYPIGGHIEQTFNLIT